MTLNWLVDPRVEAFIAVAFTQFGDWVTTFIFSFCGGGEANPLFRTATLAPDLLTIALIKTGLLLGFAVLLAIAKRSFTRLFRMSIALFCCGYCALLIWNIGLTALELML